MQAEAKKSVTGGMSSLSSLYGGLNDFSSLLTSALGNIDSNVSTLHNSTTTHNKQIESLKSVVEKYGIKLQNLELEAEAQRSKLEHALLNVSDMEKNIDTQLSDATKQMHRELLTQRTSTKMDLFAMQGTMRKSMNEAMDLIAESPKLLKSNAVSAHNPNSSNEESIQFLLEKLKILEETMMIQHNVNLQLTESVKNDEVIRKVYDSLYDQISNLETSLQTANAQNNELREKYSRDLGKMKEMQAAQQDQISQMIGALMSSRNMKKFKQTMAHIAEADEDGEGGFDVSSRKQHFSSSSRSQSGATATTPKAASTKVPPAGAIAEAEAEAEGDEEAKHSGGEQGERTRKRSHRSRRRRRHSDSESDEGSDDEQGSGDEGAAAGEGDEKVRNKHTRHHRRHHRTVRHGRHHHGNRDEDGEGEGDFDEKPDHVRMGSSKSKPTEFRRAKTFSSASASEKQTQTTKAGATSVSTNTDKAATASTATSTDKSRATTPQKTASKPSTPGQQGRPTSGVTGGEIEFDDEMSSVVGAGGGEGEAKGVSHPEQGGSYDEMDSSYSFYDSDSYYSISVAGGGGGGVTMEQLEKVAADAKNMVEELRGECSMRTDQLEESMQTFKRIALMLEDMKINYELLKAKVDSLSVSTAGGTTENFDEMRANSQYNSIQHARALWTRVHAELVHGLEKFQESESDHEDDSTSNLSKAGKDSRLFVKKVTSMIGYLDSNLAAFHPAETVAKTLKAVHPTLESMYRQAMELDALDDHIRNSDRMSEGCYFDTLLCSDDTRNLKEYLHEAMAASVPVLDESIPKVAMRQRIDQLEKQLKEKVDKITLNKVVEEIKSVAKAKVDIKEFQSTIAKLATAAELAKLNMYVADIGGRGSGTGYSNKQSESVFDVENAELQKNPAFQGLVQRFEMLGKQQLDLHNFCGTFVPREEVHEAMKAVIGEVKALKLNTINHTLFRDGLKTKADIAEVERYLLGHHFFFSFLF